MNPPVSKFGFALLESSEEQTEYELKIGNVLEQIMILVYQSDNAIESV